MAAPIGQPRVRLPAQVKAGEVIEIRTLISHIMETGQRRDQQGNIIPRDIIKRFTAKFEGQEVFAMDLASAISANPYIAFPLRRKSPAPSNSPGSTMRVKSARRPPN